MSWFRWIFVCRLGRNCARLALAGPVAPSPPPGLVLVAEYVCAGCGRSYRHELSELSELEAEQAVRPLGNVTVLRNGDES